MIWSVVCRVVSLKGMLLKQAMAVEGAPYQTVLFPLGCRLHGSLALTALASSVSSSITNPFLRIGRGDAGITDCRAGRTDIASARYQPFSYFGLHPHLTGQIAGRGKRKLCICGIVEVGHPEYGDHEQQGGVFCEGRALTLSGTYVALDVPDDLFEYRGML